MRYLFMLLALGSLFLNACGPAADEPLTSEEINAIEDDLIKAIKSGKIDAYSDQSLTYAMSPNDFMALVPEDSAGRGDLSGFATLTEEEVSLNNGDFGNDSKDLAALALYVLFNQNQVLPIAYLKWDGVEKALKKSDEKRLKHWLQGHFDKNTAQYDATLEEIRTEVIVEEIFKGLKSGEIAAYENDNLANVKSPDELDNWQPKKILAEKPDPQNPDEIIEDYVTTPIGPGDITSLKPSIDDEGNVVSFTLMTQETYSGITIDLPWVAVDMQEVQYKLSEEMSEYLERYLKAAAAVKDESEESVDTTVNS